MPKRSVKRYRFEAECERMSLSHGQERRLWNSPVKRAPAELGEWRRASDDIERFYAAPSAAMAAYHLGEFALAQEISRQALALASAFEDNWNYGNTLHFAHTVLGLLALRERDLPRAREELRKSGETPGSPQLGSFGPTMRLARELLKVGESAHVLQYFQQCRQFWKTGDKWLNIWEKKVARGEMPTFFMQSSR
jgi:hypothetical protein